MTHNNFLSRIDGNTLELHYWFDDNSHHMDANVQNRCEYELLGIIKEIASTYKVQIGIETEPLAEGGIRRWFKLTSKGENVTDTIKVALITALLTGVLVTPITTSISKFTGHLIEKIFEDPEVKQLEKEKLRLEIKKLKQETGSATQNLDSNIVIRKKKSNFYSALDRYPKVEKVSFILSPEDKGSILEKEVIHRKNFKEFILVTDELEPTEIDNAIIEIVSPVLKKGNYKWIGVYNGESIHFNMKSKEFKALVQNGQVQFKNGTTIDCQLIIKKKIDNEGLEKITGIEVTRVNGYFENDKPIETPEGKKYKRKKEAEKLQYNLFTPHSPT